MKHGWRNDSSNKNKNKSVTTNKYTSEFPPLSDTKQLEHPTDSAINESSSIKKDSDPLKSLSTDTQIDESNIKPKVPDSSQHNASSSRVSGKFETSSNRNYSQNTGNLSSHNNKNFFKRSSINSFANKEKIAQVNRDISTANNSNLYKRTQNDSNNQNINFKPQFSNFHKASRVPNHQNSLVNRGQQYNRSDRYFSKRTAPSNSNQHNMVNTTAGTGRTQHGSEHYNRK